MVKLCNITDRVILRGNYGGGNFGDDALLVACYLLLEKYGFSVAVEDAAVAYRDARFPVPDVARGSVRAPGLILYGGGTQFFSFDIAEEMAQRPSALGRMRSIVSDPLRIAKSAQTRLVNRRLSRMTHAAIGLGVGPFPPGSLEEETVAALMRRMSFLWLRDTASVEFCRKHSLPSPMLSSDLCFTEPFRNFLAPHASKQRPRSPLKVAVVLRDHKRLDRNFFGKMKALARYSRQNGVHVDFFSFSKAYDTFQLDLTNSGESVIQWDALKDKIDKFTRRLSEYSLFLTARFHGAIFALLVQRPYISIEVEPKLGLLSELIDPMKGLSIAPEAPIESYISLVHTALSGLDHLQAHALQSLEQQCIIARQGEDKFAAFLDDGHDPK